MTPRHGTALAGDMAARALNTEPWEQPPGMVKRRCSWCGFFFAAPEGSEQPQCPDCMAIGTMPTRSVKP